MTHNPPEPGTVGITRHRITMRINGASTDLEVESWLTLLDLLRDKLDLTGTKKGCDHGQCGACTVLVNGTRINACLTLAVMRDGCDITTVEGLAGLHGAGPTAMSDNDRVDAEASAHGDLHPLQRAFIEHDAFQCGYCTPGQLCSAVGLVNEGQACTTADVRELMSGNICRCGAYPQIVQAVSEVALGAQPDGTGRAGRQPASPGTSNTRLTSTSIAGKLETT